MSDVAMADGAPAPADAPVSSTVEAPVSPPNPVHSEPIPAKAEPTTEAPKKSATVAEAIERATQKVESEAKGEKAPTPVKSEPKTETKSESVRDETGRFAPKEAPKAEVTQPPAQESPKTPTRYEAPSRFSPDAKAAWETAPEPVRAEVHRAIRELEAGHQKYKADAEAYDAVRDFDAAARRNGGDLRRSLERVVGMEQAFQRNPLEGFQAVADHFGISLKAVAAHIMGQTPDQQSQQVESTMRALNAKIAQLEQQIGGVTKTFETQRLDATTQTVTQFANEHPRFEELSSDIAFFLQSGRTKDLSEAYTLAERLNPAPAQTIPTPVASAAQPTAEAQTFKATKSITGAPSAGSSLPNRPGSKSISEALDRAMATVRTG